MGLRTGVLVLLPGDRWCEGLLGTSLVGVPPAWGDWLGPGSGVEVTVADTSGFTSVSAALGERMGVEAEGLSFFPEQ